MDIAEIAASPTAAALLREARDRNCIIGLFFAPDGRVVQAEVSAELADDSPQAAGAVFANELLRGAISQPPQASGA